MRHAFSAFVLALIAIFAAIAPAPVRAAEPVILTIDGSVGQSRSFTRAELEALGLVSVNTATPWYDGVQHFEGVPLDKLMAAVAAKGAEAHVVALNRYAVDVPLSDFAKHGVILAMKRNGQAMEIKDKGPLFVIYPYDSAPELRTELYYGRSAWQVRTITVR